jgi:single-strand DNA-binding protein
MASNINRVIVTGNLTRDPEKRGNSEAVTLRVAVNGRRRNTEGQWEDVPNYFSVTVWGQQGENCMRYLSKGRPVAIDGRLQWREWTTQEGQKRESVEIVADTVQFLGGSDNSSGAGPGGGVSGADIPVNTSDFQPARSTGDDDIPF